MGTRWLQLGVAASGQQTTYYLGDVGEQLARFRSHLGLGIYELPEEFGPLEAVARQGRRTARVRVLSASTGGAFIAVMIAVWGVAIAKLSRQARELPGHAERLETANADLDAFAGRVAHDLKNALGPIWLAPSMLRRASTRPAIVLEIAARTERSARSIVAMLDAQLAFLARPAPSTKPSQATFATR